MQTLLNTLYVMTPNAYAHLENATIRIDVDREKKLQVPLHHLSSVVCFGNVLVSPALMHRLAEEGKSLVLLSKHGRFKARLEGPIQREYFFASSAAPARRGSNVRTRACAIMCRGKNKK